MMFPKISHFDYILKLYDKVQYLTKHRQHEAGLYDISNNVYKGKILFGFKRLHLLE